MVIVSRSCINHQPPWRCIGLSYWLALAVCLADDTVVSSATCSIHFYCHTTTTTATLPSQLCVHWRSR